MWATNKSKVQSLDLIFWQLMSFKRFNEEIITLEWPFSDCCQWTMFRFLFHRSIFNMQKYTHFKSLRQYSVHGMSLPNVLKHYSYPQMKKNWFINTCGINKGRTCITFSSNIQDLIVIYIFLNVQERKFYISTLTFTLLMSILFPFTHQLLPYKNNISWKVTHNTIHTKNQQILGGVKYDKNSWILCRPLMGGDGCK
jgi:hypothetical protein